MANGFMMPSWIALFLGLYALAAAIGEWRDPGGWARMFEEFSQSPALRFLTGFVCLFIGAMIYLASPWRPGDWLATVITVLGGWIVVEGFLLLAFGSFFMRFAQTMIGGGTRVWSAISALFGVALIVVAFIRFQIF